MPSFRVKARQVPVKNIFGEYFFGSTVCPSGQTVARFRLSSADEGFSHKTRNDRHGVLGEAEVEILFVAEALEPPGGAVLAEGLFGACEIVVLARNASTTTTAALARAASRAPRSPAA
jgi:hypothetical protein